MVILVFRAITHLRVDIQSHYLSRFRRSEPCFVSFGIQSHVLLCSAFRVTSSIGVQSHIFIRRSEPLHHSFRHLEPCFALFGVQSHIFVLAFRAITSFISVIRAITYSFRHSRSLHHLFRSSGPHFQFDTQSPRAYLSFDLSPFSSILAFRAIVHTHSGILSHLFSLVLEPKVIFHTYSCILSLFFS